MALTGLTAICAVENSLQLKSGETILIQGGAGGVAAFAIQLAKHSAPASSALPARATSTTCASLGADEVIDYKTTDFTKVVKDCDAVFDTVGDDVAMRSFAVLKPGGRATFIASGATAPKPDRSDVTALASGRAARAQVHGADRRALRQGRRPPAARHAVRAGEGRGGAAASARRVTSRASWC